MILGVMSAVILAGLMVAFLPPPVVALLQVGLTVAGIVLVVREARS